MERDLRTVVIGLGYVGLPLLLEAREHGVNAAGLDASQRVVDLLRSGESHVDDIDGISVAAAIAGGMEVTTDPACLAETDVAIICVPTPLTDDMTPDLSAVRSAAYAIADHLQKGMLVILESTTYPGTTDGPVREILETSGLKAGVDFHLAFSPERIDPGNATYGLHNTPKVVGGFTPACTDVSIDFYSRIINEVVPVSGTREAEMAKLLENTYRHVNIALVNEMAIFSHDLGIDLWEAIRAAATKPFGFEAFYPGPGVGGHCIPIDPNYLSYQVRTLGYQFRFVELAQEISSRMPAYVASRVQDILNRQRKPLNGSRIALLGLTYKNDIADDRETPARPLVRHLRHKGAHVVGVDPYVDAFNVDGKSIELIPDVESALASADLAVLLQTHQQFDLEALGRGTTPFLDTRGKMNGPAVERL